MTITKHIAGKLIENISKQLKITCKNEKLYCLM